MNSRHFRLTRLAHMRGLKATRNPDGSYTVTSSRPGHAPYRVTLDACPCDAVLSCTHLELVRKIEVDRDADTQEWQDYQNAWRADFFRLRLRILRGKVRGTDRDYLNWCKKARPASPVATTDAQRERAAAAFGESFAAKVFA